MRYRTVLFDLDGTLIDQFHAIYRCHVHAMRALGLLEPTYAQVRDAVGGGLDTAIARLAGAENVAALLPLFNEHWAATSLQDAKLLAGAEQLLTGLNSAGIRCAVLTNKRGNAARDVCAYFRLTPQLTGIFGANDTPWIKPDPRFTEYALTALGSDATSTCLVGDSTYDLATAKNSGLEFFGVTTGTHTADELRAAGAKHIYPDLTALTSDLIG